MAQYYVIKARDFILEKMRIDTAGEGTPGHCGYRRTHLKKLRRLLGIYRTRLVSSWSSFSSVESLCACSREQTRWSRVVRSRLRRLGRRLEHMLQMRRQASAPANRA